MYSLPNDDGVLLQRTSESVAAAGGSPIQIWRQGQRQDVNYRSANATLYGLDTIADRMLFYTYNTRRRPPIRFAYLNQAECDGGACAVRFLDGWPVWSPDRKRTVVSHGDGVLWLGDDAGEPQRAVANGRSTVWLDNSRFAFIQTDDGMQVAMMTLSNLEPKTLFEMERLVDELPDATDATRVTRAALASHPAMPDRLFVGARIGPRPSAEDTHVFVYDLATDQITELLQVDHPLEPYRSLRFSPDGRWLFVHSVQQRGSGWHLHIYNNQTGDILTYSSEFSLAFPG